jgi:mannosyltransferase
LLAALPAFLILADQAPTWVHSTWLEFKPGEVIEALLGLYGLPWFTGAGFAIALIVMAFRNESRVPAALLTMALFPVIVSLAVSATLTPIFLPRTLIAVNLPFVTLLGLGAVSVRRMGASVYLLLLLLAAQLTFDSKQMPPRENWYGAVAWLKANIRPGDVIYAYPNETALPLHYALRERKIVASIRPIPEAVPSHDPTGWYPTGSRGVVSLPQYRLDQIASDAQSQAAERIWLVRLSAPKYDKGNGFVRSLLRDRVPIAIWPNRKLEDEPLGVIDIIGLEKRKTGADPKN